MSASVNYLNKSQSHLEHSPDSPEGEDKFNLSPTSLTPRLDVEHASDRVKRSFYRGTLFQALVIGTCAFLSPGIWNSMNSLGAAGSAKPYLINAANALTFGSMVFTCLLGSVLSNRIGLRWSLLFGTLGYAPYAGGLYANKTAGTEWLIIFGAFLCGVTAGVFWSVEGAIILGYPEASKRGRYLAIWLGFKFSGQIVGGCINLALNATTSGGGSVSSSTYIVFIVLQCIAPLFALLLSEPDKVQRDDGTKVTVSQSKLGIKLELLEVWKVARRPEVLLIAPLAVYSSWMGPFTLTFTSLYFSVRSRALASLVTALLSVAANLILGLFLDYKKIRLATRARSSYIFVMAVGGASWIWATVLQKEFNEMATIPKYDWTNGTEFARAWTLVLVFYMSTALIQNELYWIIGAISRDPADISRLSSVLRSLESAGSAIGYGISAEKTLNKFVPLGLNFSLWFVSGIPAYFAIRKIGVELSGGYSDKSTESLEGSIEKN